jgi:triacylglycerol lipase
MTAGSEARPFIPPSHPVVLMHGFGAFLHLLAPVSLNPLIAALQKREILVFAPRVEPYSPVNIRVRAWKKSIDEILRTTGSARVHLIAYSSGGLDARYLISHEGGFRFISTLTTISTPHRGSTVATTVLEQPELIRKGLTALADWMGRRINASPSDAQRALEQLTPVYMEGVFNPQSADHPDVRYASWAGRAGIGTETPVNPLLRPTNRLLFEAEGINDGIVSVRSAMWTGFKGTIEADHGRQIGIRAWNGAFEPEPFITAIVGELERPAHAD